MDKNKSDKAIVASICLGFAIAILGNVFFEMYKNNNARMRAKREMSQIRSQRDSMVKAFGQWRESLISRTLDKTMHIGAAQMSDDRKRAMMDMALVEYANEYDALVRHHAVQDSILRMKQDSLKKHMKE